MWVCGALDVMIFRRGFMGSRRDGEGDRRKPNEGEKGGGERGGGEEERGGWKKGKQGGGMRKKK